MMTTTGDEPSLPQPSDDNAPMISSIQTRVIADARGAYLAGNLEALIEKLSEAQQEQLLHLAYRRLSWTIQHIPFGSVPAATLELCIQAYERWIDEQTHEHAVAINNALLDGEIIVDDFDEFFDEEGDFVFGLADENRDYEALAGLIRFEEEATPLGAAYLDMHNTMIHLSRERQITEDEAGNLAKHWYVEAVWSILQGKQPPPFELPT